MNLDSSISTASAAPPIKQKRPPHRVWSVQDKRRIVEEALVPGASVAAVGRRHSVNTNMIFRWRIEYRKGAYGPTPPESTGQNFIPVGVIGDDGHIVRSDILDVKAKPAPVNPPPLQIEGTVANPNPPPPRVEKPAQRVDLELPNKTRLTFDPNIDEAVFRRLIAMVKDAT
jgi:transposase